MLLDNIYDELNNENSDIEPFANPKEITIGHLLVAHYNNEYSRANIISFLAKGNRIVYQVLFIDLGVRDEIEFSDLRRFRGVSAQFIDIPPRVFECRLAEISPSSIKSEKNIWTREDINTMASLTKKRSVCAKVNLKKKNRLRFVVFDYFFFLDILGGQ